MSEVKVRVRLARSPDAIETVKINNGAPWDVLQNALLSQLQLGLHEDEELYCVFINVAGKVGSPVICGDGNKFWRLYENKYSTDTTDTVLFEVNTRQARLSPPPKPLDQPPPASQNRSSSHSQPIKYAVHKSYQPMKVQVPLRQSAVTADIYSASRAGNLSQVQDLIKHHASTVNARDEHSSTALHYAAECGHLPVVTFLISQKAFKNNRNSRGMTPLLNAVANGHLDVVKYLISERAFTFVLDNEGNGPLHLAAKHNHPHILEWLLKNGSIDKSLRNIKGEIYSAFIQAPLASNITISDLSPATTVIVPKHNTSVLKWRLVCNHNDFTLKQEQVVVLSDLDHSSWQSLCFGLFTRFNVEGISNYWVKDKYTFKILPKQNEDMYRSIPSLIEYIVLVEQDGDEGSGHVKDLAKLYKILNKIYRPNEGMTFEIHVNGHILIKYQKSFQKQPDLNMSQKSVPSVPIHTKSPPYSENLSTSLISDSSPTTLALKFEDVHNSNDDDLPANEQNEYVPSSPSPSSRSVRDSNRRLHVACTEGSYANAKAALAQHAEVNNKDDELCTPLHRASLKGHLQVCQLLIAAKCFKNNRNNRGMTPLLNAVANGHLDVVKYLISERAFTFVLDNEGNGPLHLAAKHNHPHILEWLLENCDIDTEITNESGETYLFYVEKKKIKTKNSPEKMMNLDPASKIASENSVHKITAAEHGKSFSTNKQDNSFYQPVSAAAHASRVVVHRTEACVKACIANNYDAAFQFLEEEENGIDVNGKDEVSDKTLLHLSCEYGKYDFVLSLLQGGAHVNAQDKKGNTPLHYATHNCHLEIMSLLHSWKAKLLGNDTGSTPLHVACSDNKCPDTVKNLISMGACVKDIDYTGNSALHLVVDSQNTSLCLWMCQQPGADECVYMVNVMGLSPYDLARNSGQIEVSTALLTLAENKKIKDTIRVNSERLLKECVDGRWAAVSGLISTFSGPTVMDLNLMDKDSGKHAIHFCSEAGDLACVSKLISSGAEVDIFDSTEFKMTALHYACAGGHLDVATELLLHGATVEAEDQAGFTPLFHACACDHLDIGCILVESYEADLNHVNWKTHDSILHLACQIGSLDWIQLVEKCSDLTILSELKNNLGQTPLDVAVLAKHTDIILYAKDKREARKVQNVQKCAKALWCEDLHAALDIAKGGIEPNFSLSHSTDPVKDAAAPTLFHLACEKGDIHIVKEFLNQGGSVSLKDFTGLTPLHYACMGFRPASILHMKDDSDQHESTEVESQSRQLEIVRWLKKANADINAHDENGFTPLLLACLYGNVLLAQWLIDRGGDIHMKNKSGHTVIHLACESGSTQLVKWLLQEIQIKPTELDASCTHAVLMSHAAKSGNVELLAWLYHSLDIDRTIYTQSKKAAMEIKLQCLIKHQEKKFRQAAFEDNVNVMEAILSMTDMPVNVNSQESAVADIWGTTAWVEDTTGDTALHRACRGQHAAAVKFLLDNFADVNAVNQNGITPLHLTVITGNVALFDLLLENGANVDILDKEGNSILTFSCMLKNTTLAESISATYSQFSEFRPNLKGVSPLRVATDAMNIELVVYFAKHPWISRQTKKLIEATLLKNVREIQYMIESGISVDVYSEDSYRRTPLHIATSQGNRQIIQLLLEAGASVEALDSSDRNALHIASSCGAVEIAKLLLEEFPPYSWLENSNAEENTNTDIVLQAVDELGMTPVAHACLNGQMITAAYLIGQGANLKTCDVYGSTILHLACKSGNTSLVQWLMDGFDMDFTMLNFYKQTPIDIAQEANHQEIVQLLMDRLEAARLQTEQVLVAQLEAEREKEILRIEQVAAQQEAAKIRWETEERENQVHNAHQDEAKHILLMVMKESLAKACHDGTLEEVREILTCDINPNMVLNDEGQTGLHIATLCGHVAIVDLFLQTPGVDKDLLDAHHLSALHIACSRDDDACVEVLMGRGVNPLIASRATGVCAIDVVCSTDNAALLKVLLSNATTSTLTHIQEAFMKREKGKNGGDGPSLLDRIIISNSYHCLEEMLEFISPISHLLEARDPGGKTPLNAAATNGHLQIVKMLLTFHPEVDSKDYQGMTPLMNAIFTESLELVKTLMQAGASIFEVDIKGNSPLHLCCDSSIEMAIWFIQSGADIYCENEEGRSPLQVAESKHKEVLIRLLKNKQNNVLEVLEVCQSGDIEWLRHTLSKNRIHVHRGNKEKVTGLHLASFHGHKDICRLLIAEGGLIEVEDSAGRTPVHYACMACNVDMIALLVELGGSVFRQNTEGESSLHMVVQSNDLSIVPITDSDLKNCLTWLVDSKHMSVEMRSDDGTSVLMAAARAGNLPAIKFLHQRGATVLPQNQIGCNAFHLAVEAGHTVAASWLLEHYSKDITIDTPDANGRTSFMIACESGTLETLKWLYDNGCNFKRLGSSLDAKDSPLHAVCRRGDQATCEWLVTHAANIYLLNSNQESPANVARLNNFESLAVWLEEQDSEHGREIFKRNLQTELELSLQDKFLARTLKCTDLPQALFDELYGLYLLKVKEDAPQAISPEYLVLALLLLNSAATIGNLENIRDLIFNIKHISAECDSSQGEDSPAFNIINAQSPSTGQTPLFHAVSAGHLRVCQFLLTHGARCNITDHSGRNPLNVAKGRKDRQDIYEILVSYASPEDLAAPVVAVSEAELYSNHWMYADDQSEATVQLMKYCYLGEGHFDKIVQVIEDFGADVNYESDLKLSPLLVATNENHINLVKYLVDSGADINHVDRNNTSALMLACQNKNRALALYLINNRADLTIVDSTTGDSALHIICKQDLVELMTDIVNLPRSVLRRLDMKVENLHNGNNLLHYAVLADSVAMTALLLHQGLDVNACNTQDDSNSALHYACMRSHTPLVELLLSKHAQANICNRLGVTPLSITLRSHNLTLSRLLHKHGADITECDANTGDSFLHHACREGEVEIAKWLIRVGVDPELENVAGETAAKLAHTSGCEDLLEWILAWILANQLNKPIEDVLTEAHTLPLPRESRGVERKRECGRGYNSSTLSVSGSAFVSAGVLPGSTAESPEVELEEENTRLEDSSDMLEFDV